MAKIYVGVGHGGSDSGACANGFKEKDITLAIGKACCEELIRHGVNAKISRTTDKDVSITQKVRESDAFKADYCMDIHINAGGGDGCEVYYHHAGGKSKQLAEKINDALVGIGQNSRGLKVKWNSARTDDYFGMIRRPDAPSVLVECGFIDNKADLSAFDTADEQKNFGIAIAHGVLKQCGIAIKDAVVPTPTPTPTPANTAAFISRTYKNGSTKEYVYKTTDESLKSRNSMGYLSPYETAQVIGRYRACPIVVYGISNGGKKVGFVKYEGGVTAQNYVRKAYQNGSTKEPVYSTTVDCKKGINSIGYLDKYERCDCVGIIYGYYVVVYKITGTNNYKVGFVRYSGGVK